MVCFKNLKSLYGQIFMAVSIKMTARRHALPSSIQFSNFFKHKISHLSLFDDPTSLKFLVSSFNELISMLQRACHRVVQADIYCHHKIGGKK